jgi:glycosyltransferase involved in cell wall biosynthesis
LDALPPAPTSLTCLLVIPFYQDAGRLKPFLRELLDELPASFSLQIVDDGSGAEHRRQLEELIAATALRPARAALLPPRHLPVNQGKGAAVRAGWDNYAAYDLVGFVDADGAVCAREILRLYDYFCAHQDAVDAVIASRVKILGRHIDRRLARHLIGRVFATIVSLASRLPVYDSQCGYKLLRSRALGQVLPRLCSNRFAFDVELIMELAATGAVIHEFPVDWVDQPDSKVKVWRDGLPMLLDVGRSARKVRRNPPTKT